MKKALASAWRAAIVVNTTLAEPEMLDAASRFHDRREQWLFDECVRRSGDIASIIQEYFARIGPLDPRNLLLASAFLVGHGVLRTSPGIEV